MPLTHEELADIDKLLGRMEKNARAWRIVRWPLVGLGLLSAGMAVWAFMIAQTFWETTIPINPGDNVTGIGLLLERVTVMNFCVLYVSAIFQGCIGGLLLVFSLANWNKGRKDGLLIKLARSYVDEQRPGTEGPL